MPDQPTSIMRVYQRRTLWGRKRWWYDCSTCDITCGPFGDQDAAIGDIGRHAEQQHQPVEQMARALAGAAHLNPQRDAPAWDSLDDADRDQYREQARRIVHPPAPDDQPYRDLLVRLEHEHARSDQAATLSTVDECRIAHSGIASGLRLAAVHAVHIFEGAEARAAYVQALAPDSVRTTPDNPAASCARRPHCDSCDDLSLTEADVDRMMADGTPVELVAAPDPQHVSPEFFERLHATKARDDGDDLTVSADTPAPDDFITEQCPHCADSESTHRFRQHPEADVKVCADCGKWPDHHLHTSDSRTCGCDRCRAWHADRA